MLVSACVGYSRVATPNGSRNLRRAYPNEGQVFTLGAQIRKRTIPFEILPQAFTDLTAMRRQRGVSDAVLEVVLELVEGNNTLLPESHDEGRSMIVRLTLEGQQPLPNRLGEVGASAITLAAVSVVIVALWAIRLRRIVLRRQRGEEVTAVSLIKNVQDTPEGQKSVHASGRLQDYLSGTMKWRRKRVGSASTTSSPRVHDEFARKDDVTELTPVKESPDSSPVKSVATPRSVRLTTAQSAARLLGSPLAVPQASEITFPAAETVNSSVISAVDVSPQRRTPKSGQLEMTSNESFFPSPSLHTLSAGTQGPPESDVPEASVLSPSGVPLFASSHAVSHNARVRALRAASRNEFSP
jgi:hypothetical protein